MSFAALTPCPALFCRGQEWVADLNERVELARAEGYQDILRETVNKQLDRAHEAVQRERAAADRYHQLKFV